MDEAHPGLRSGIGVEQHVEGVVAHIGACRIGHRGRNLPIPNGLGHPRHGNRGKVGRRAIRRHKFSPGLVAGIVGEGKRSFRITRAKPDGKSYARDIAQSYGLTYETILERVKNA